LRIVRNELVSAERCAVTTPGSIRRSLRIAFRSRQIRGATSSTIAMAGTR
jgi:hypothetical protein